MSRLVIRHGVARQKMAASRKDAGVFGGPLLMETSFTAAHNLGIKLRAEGVNTQRIATSETLRSIQTAIAIGGIGLEDIETYSVLNEVPTAVDKNELTAMLAEGILPDETLAAGERIITNAPIEPIWISHGLTIAGLTAIVRIRQGLPVEGHSLLPSNLEMRELEV